MDSGIVWALNSASFHSPAELDIFSTELIISLQPGIAILFSFFEVLQELGLGSNTDAALWQ